jgi:hypothetical protein
MYYIKSKRYYLGIDQMTPSTQNVNKYDSTQHNVTECWVYCVLLCRVSQFVLSCWVSHFLQSFKLLLCGVLLRHQSIFAHAKFGNLVKQHVIQSVIFSSTVILSTVILCVCVVSGCGVGLNMGVHVLVMAGNTKGGCITVPLTSCLTCLD